MEENLPPNPEATPTPPSIEPSVPPPISAPPPASPPPLPPRPPVIAAAMPGPAPRRCGAWKIVTLLLVLALGASLLWNVRTYVRHFTAKSANVRHKRPALEEVLIEDNGSKNKIAIVEIEGVISSADRDRSGHNLVEGVREELDAAAEDSSVKAVILKVNSPGGEVLASDEIYNAIKNFQDDTGKPVIASMQTLAASGGYYVSAPCRWIVASELTLTGSIGVIMHGWNVSGLMDKLGVRAETYKSGAHKDMLSPFRRDQDIDPEERKMVQSLIMETYGKFTNIVATGRGTAFKKNKQQGRELDETWSHYADGRVLSGQQAFDLGFVDELGDFDTAIVRAQKIAGVPDADLIQYQQPFDLSEIFSFLGKTQTPSMKIDLGVEFPKLQSGCLYFLYRYAIP